MIFYITPRIFGGMVIPIPIQNAYLKHFANQKSLEFSLPASEVCFPEKYPVLYSLLEKACKKNECLVLLSIYQLPFDIPDRFDSLLKNNEKFKKIQLMTGLEGLNCNLHKAWQLYKELYNPLRKNSGTLKWGI